MTPKEALKLLRGGPDDNKILFDAFIEKAQSEPLEDWEVGMLEAIKKNLFPPEPKVVSMEASLAGQAKAGT